MKQSASTAASIFDIRRLAAPFWSLAVIAGLGTVQPAEARQDWDRELTCLALNIYFEARGEPEEGKLAVGHVVMNRVAHPRFPRSICRVVQQGGEVRRHRCQFSWWCDGRSDRPRDRQAWRESRRIAKLVYAGAADDPTEGALWYHADYVRPHWRSDFERGPKIGKHIFYQIDDIKRQRPEQPAAEPTVEQPVEHDEPTVMVMAAAVTAPTKPRIEMPSEDFTKGVLSVFGIGLLGVGVTTRRRKPRA